jgi:NodT family efflux transporter outer membrane factor (OMF) lipoprotein
MIEVRMVALTLGLLAAAGGCKLGPDYHPPKPVAGAESPFVTAVPGAISVEPPPDGWWKLYQDPMLDRFLEDAFAANADLRAAEANLSAARAVLVATKAGRYPQTEANVSGIRGRDPTVEEILLFTGQAPQTLWLFDALLDVSYEIDLFGRVRRSIEASRADLQAVAAATADLKVTVAAETTRAYAQICALGEQIAVARRSLEVVGREARITTERYRAGAGSEFDVVRAEGLVAQVRASIPPLEGQRRSALFQLAALLGRAPASAPTEAQDCTQSLRLKRLIPVGDGAALLKRRPDVRQADRRIASATARIGVATAELYPTISLRGFIGGVSTALEQLASNDAFVWGVGPSISWTFPQQVAARARLRQAEATAVAALAHFDSVVLQALREIEQALATYGAELDRRQALADVQDKARRAFEMAHDQFLAGSVSTLDLLTSEQALVNADASVAASNAALAQNQITLFKVLGGGWQ